MPLAIDSRGSVFDWVFILNIGNPHAAVENANAPSLGAAGTLRLHSLVAKLEQLGGCIVLYCHELALIPVLYVTLRLRPVSRHWHLLRKLETS